MAGISDIIDLLCLDLCPCPTQPRHANAAEVSSGLNSGSLQLDTFFGLKLFPLYLVPLPPFHPLRLDVPDELQGTFLGGKGKRVWGFMHFNAIL